MKGSPVWPDIQLQIGLWFTTWHCALNPQVPGHGSWHFNPMQALFCGQSPLITHSGLQDGGDPMYDSMQEHTACESITRHWLYSPQGDGKQGFTGSSFGTK